MKSSVQDRQASPSEPGTNGPSADKASPVDSLRDVQPRLKELGEYVNYLFAARIDAIKLAIRKAGIYAAVGIVALLAAAAFVVTAVVLLCLGVARGLTALFGGRAWAGDLAAAVLFFAILGLGVWFGLGRLGAVSRERTIRKYAARQQQQRASFGTDVSQRAAEHAPGHAGDRK